ncbi:MULTISPECIES: dioxygenase [unclassified Pigmentiphaga]|uniref:dioxygenase family protein n=1 Tax=unclassified Pigmentiphaga TaxID=2626614 RepID=UPI0014056112|nr:MULTISPECIES: dioxygenase [unclassified Pigmentiphaga]
MEQRERLSAIWSATVEKLKEVVREYEVTEDELHLAGDFLNRLGASGMCRSLLDVGLAMTSIDVHAKRETGTRANLTGPYHREHPMKPDGKLAETDIPPDAPLLILTGTVKDAVTGKAISNAEIDAWHADHNGIYDLEGTHLRGVVRADENGDYCIQTILPHDYSEHDHDPIGELFRAMGRTNIRAAHIHLKVRTGDTLRLTTQIFMSTSKSLKTDYVEGAVSDDLTVALERDASVADQVTYRGRFDILL